MVRKKTVNTYIQYFSIILKLNYEEYCITFLTKN